MIDRRESGKDFRALCGAKNRPKRSFVLSDRKVGINADNEKIAMPTSPFKGRYVAGMQDIETAVRRNDGFSLRAGALCDLHRLTEGDDLLL